MKPARWLAALAFLLAILPAIPAGAQSIQGVVVDPPAPTSRDRVRLTFVGTQHPECPLVIEGGAKDPAGSTIGFSVTIPECGSPLPAEEGFKRTFEMEDPLEAETYLVYVVFKGRPVPSLFEVFEVREPSPRLVLGDHDRFLALAEWKNPRDGSLTRESGYVWFFSPENIELTVKILDGRAVNGRYWVFLASMTDLPFTVTIRQCPASPLVGQPCNIKTYTNPKGVNRNVLEVNAFPDL